MFGQQPVAIFKVNSYDTDLRPDSDMPTSYLMLQEEGAAYGYDGPYYVLYYNTADGRTLTLSTFECETESYGGHEWLTLTFSADEPVRKLAFSPTATWERPELGLRDTTVYSATRCREGDIDVVLDGGVFVVEEIVFPMSLLGMHRSVRAVRAIRKAVDLAHSFDGAPPTGDEWVDLAAGVYNASLAEFGKDGLAWQHEVVRTKPLPRPLLSELFSYIHLFETQYVGIDETKGRKAGLIELARDFAGLIGEMEAILLSQYQEAGWL